MKVFQYQLKHLIYSIYRGKPVKVLSQGKHDQFGKKNLIIVECLLIYTATNISCFIFLLYLVLIIVPKYKYYVYGGSMWELCIFCSILW